MSEAQTYVIVDREPPIAIVRLNEPEVRNALSPAMVRELTEKMEELKHDAEILAIVITGNGPVFCGGADMRRFRVMSPLEDREEYEEILAMNRMFWRYPKPTICSIHGAAMGNGANMAGWCDLAVAEESAVFSYPEVKVGIASATVVATLLRLVGRKRLNELVLTGDRFSAADAERFGLINRRVPDGQALQTAKELALKIAANSPDGVRLTKEVIRVATDMEYDKALEYARDIRVISRMSPAFQERLRQYMESGRFRKGEK